MTNPYAGNEPYGTAWQNGYDYASSHSIMGDPSPPDFSGWGYDASVTGAIENSWREGALAAGAGATAPASSSSADGSSSTPQVQYDQAPGPGPVAVVAQDGSVVSHGQAIELRRSGDTTPAPTLLEVAVQAAVTGAGAMPGIGPLVTMVNIAHQLGCTVAIGLDGELASIVGGDAGGGVYYTPAGHFGLYGTLAADLGAVVGASISEAMTVVRGEASALAGDCLAITGGGGEGVVGSGSLLFSPQGGFLGIAGSIGLGVGLPAAAFAQYQHTWIKPLH